MIEEGTGYYVSCAVKAVVSDDRVLLGLNDRGEWELPADGRTRWTPPSPIAVREVHESSVCTWTQTGHPSVLSCLLRSPDARWRWPALDQVDRDLVPHEARSTRSTGTVAACHEPAQSTAVITAVP